MSFEMNPADRPSRVPEQVYDPSAQQGLWSDNDATTYNHASDASQALTGTSEAPQEPVMTTRERAIAAGAKLPQDHRKPSKRTITVDGLDVKVNLAHLQDDYELMELMAEMEGSGDEENLPVVIKLVKTVLGDQYTVVKEHCRVDGRVSAKKMMEFIQAIFEQVGELGE